MNNFKKWLLLGRLILLLITIPVIWLNVFNKEVVDTVAVMHEPIERVVGRNISTNTTFDEMVDIQKNYCSAVGKVERLHFQNGNGQMIDGIWYYVLDDAELLGISSELKEHLGMYE